MLLRHKQYRRVERNSASLHVMIYVCVVSSNYVRIKGQVLKIITKGSELMLIKWDGQENRPDFIKGVRGPAWSTTVKSSITSNPSIVTFHTDTLPLIKMRLDFLFSVLSCLVNLTLAGKTNPNNPSSNGKNLTSLITGEQVSRTCTSAYMVTNIAIGKLNWGKRLKSR